MNGVRFVGAVPRKELIKYQLQSEVQVYPCTYDELFCYAVAECQVAGVLPITTQTGALETTNMGIQFAGSDYESPRWRRSFAEIAIENMLSPNLEKFSADVQYKAIQRFSLETVLEQWDKILYE